ncbi:hypothetical protein F2P81_004272 [Scophthalmus maximus]|uniref:Uncharacterized protein n=1 Tax=Scophthalmus maximus TaxID=52904 RepID=A0A6A4TCJ7_SCOMX|nr:hypothetical protein F2P81_004272 [Scophthalmus maximus]
MHHCVYFSKPVPISDIPIQLRKKKTHNLLEVTPQSCSSYLSPSSDVRQDGRRKKNSTSLNVNRDRHKRKTAFELLDRSNSLDHRTAPCVGRSADSGDWLTGGEASPSRLSYRASDPVSLHNSCRSGGSSVGYKKDGVVVVVVVLVVSSRAGWTAVTTSRRQGAVVSLCRKLVVI